MKKIKGFTLLEMIMVIAIIWIISASLAGFKKNAGKNDIWREAVNVIYKEMNQYVKDFQRNKIWENEAEDELENEHEIEYLILNFNDNETQTWDKFTVGNLYIYTWYRTNANNEIEEYKTWYFEWTTLIKNQKYSAFQVLKWSDNYIFYTRNEHWKNIPWILISRNWKIYTWKVDNILDNDDFEHFHTPNITDNTIYKFLICWWYWEAKPIWIISINAVTKIANLDRCESDKYAWIICNTFATCD